MAVDSTQCRECGGPIHIKNWTKRWGDSTLCASCDQDADGDYRFSDDGTEFEMAIRDKYGPLGRIGGSMAPFQGTAQERKKASTFLGAVLGGVVEALSATARERKEREGE